jgi:anti-sigma factor RsiW
MNETTDRSVRTERPDRAEERLERWLAGEASADDERALAAEAAADPALAAELSAHREVAARLRALPRELAPARDLFPEIARRTQSATGVGPLRSAALFPPLPRAAVRLALAASLLAALALGWSLRAKIEPRTVVVETTAPRAAAPPAPSVARTAYAATGREFDAIRDELRRAIDQRRDSLPPETRRLVFESLETIERAIGEIEAALAAAPTDPELARTYISYRQREIDLLRQANRLAARL